jgi:hypothetical protein
LDSSQLCNIFAPDISTNRKQKRDITKDIETKRRKWQTTSAPMAWLFLPENEQVQYLQKIALRAENPFGRK